MKKALLVALFLVVVGPLGASAQSGYCNPPQSSIVAFLWPCGTGPGAMREVMTYYTVGPTPSYSNTGFGGGLSQPVSYPQMNQLGVQYQYPQQYTSYQQPTYQQPQYQYQQPQYSYPTVPQYQQPQYPTYPQQYPSYQQPQYYPQQQYPYAQPQYSQGWFGYPSPQGSFYQPAPSTPTPTQLAGINPRPVGGYDIWGDPLCDWGPGYYGHACTQDPHQWILDTYTGQWY